MRNIDLPAAGSYQLTNNPKMVFRVLDGAWVPVSNLQYQKWLAVPNTPLPAVTPNSNTISSLDFFNRFTDAEKAAIWITATTKNSDPAIGVGLTHGLAAGQINLTDTAVNVWMDALVAEDVITSNRKIEILTP